MKNTSIVIGRQYGSGGFNIGKKLAEDLGYEFFDKELVELVAEKSNFSEETVKKMDESAKGSFLYSIAMGNFSFGAMGGPMHYDLPINDKLFLTQSEIIKEKGISLVSDESSIRVLIQNVFDNMQFKSFYHIYHYQYYLLYHQQIHN